MLPLPHIRKFDQKLGVGAYGVVYLGFDDQRGCFVAIKEIPYGGEESSRGEVAANQILQEMRVMQKFRPHPNLVGYYGARRSSVGVQLVTEYMGGGSLERLMKLRGPLPECVVRRYTRDILRGLRCLHEDFRVCHRDVKPGNVLLTPEGRCKLTDFGVSKMLVTAAPKDLHRPLGLASDADAPEGKAGHHHTPLEFVEDPFMQTTVGTPWYMAPEVIAGGEASDNDNEDEEQGDEDKVATAERETGSASHSSSYYNPLRGIAFRGGEDPGAAVHISQYERKMRAHGYTTSADIWSVGVSVYEMISGQKPFGAGLVNPTAVLFRIINSAAHPPKLPDEIKLTVSHELRNFIDLCFVYDKALRPSAAELLAHPWLAAEDSDDEGTGVCEEGRRRSSGSASRATRMDDEAHSASQHSSRHRSGLVQEGRSAAAPSPPPLTQRRPHGSGASAQPTTRNSTFLRSAFSPMLDAADLPPTTLGLQPSRRRSSGNGSRSTDSGRVPGVAVTSGHPSRRNSSPYSTSYSSCSAPSPTFAQQRQQEQQPPLSPHTRVGHRTNTTSNYSVPPGLPSLPECVDGRGCRTGQTTVTSSGSHRPPPPAQPSKGTHPHSSATTGEGFFSLDGHYVDLIARIPSPHH